ncbi:Uncharacterised protein [Weeksella virosa]|uniref:hypothetical protein n=1 Tax=Weeksella virosa TaxID=1014 RepID=UPI000E03BE79|nr:hypothetical protein [Weeksella virosa]SUP53746.1 Uncharacterised protein [Weeksella virosa]
MHTKTFTLLIILLVASSLYAQVGINTENPQQRFHVDGQRDNPTTGSPTVDQQKNDVVITEDGRVGVGTTEPTESLDIDGKARIRNTNTLDSETVSPLLVDESGLVGKAKELSIFSYFNTDEDPPYVHEFKHNSKNTPWVLPFTEEDLQDNTMQDFNSLYFTVTDNHELVVPAKGNYLISGSAIPVLVFDSNDGVEFAHVFYDIEMKKEGETKWKSITGGKKAYPRKHLSFVFCSITFPTTIVALEPGTLLRMSIYSSNNSNQTNEPDNLTIDKYYHNPWFTLDIVKL